MKKPLDNIKDIDIKNQLQFLQEEYQPNPLELSAVPTATEPLLEDNETGVYSGVIYTRIGNTIYVITPSSTITI